MMNSESTPPLKRSKVSIDIPFIPVLPSSYYEPIPLSYSVDKRNANTLLKLLQNKFNDLGISHLKRIRKQTNNENDTIELWVVLCKVSECDMLNQMQEECKIIGIEDINNPSIVRVPEISPLHKAHLEDATKYWPVKVLEKSLVDPFDMELQFTSLEIQTISEHMKYAIQLIRNTDNVPISALLIDPKTLKIVAEATDTSNIHPLGHAVMNVITKKTENSSNGDYLCSGLWLIVTREPCPMCAMAAVHSRIGKVFYSHENNEVGALGSRYNIHLESQLNHHYSVYKNIYKEDTKEIWEEYITKLSN